MWDQLDNFVGLSIIAAIEKLDQWRSGWMAPLHEWEAKERRTKLSRMKKVTTNNHI
jgi:hypothetical protein